MDDCNLEKLVVKPGKLNPIFHKDTTEYAVTVASDVTKIRVEPLTSDTGASYSISGSGGGKEVSLPEGTVTDIKIEVTSEDGTIKNYFIHVKRLSAKDATLSDLKLDVGYLEPEFNPDVTAYSCLLPCNISKITLKPTAPDAKNVVLVCGEKPGTPVSLNVGETNLPIEVTSADGSNKQIYSVDVMRKQLPRYIKFTDAEQSRLYECPISLSPLYRPISIRGSDPKHTYSAPLIDNVTRTSKIDPLNEMPLETDWRIVDYELEKKMAALPACVPLTYGGTSDTSKFGDLGTILPKCSVAPKVEDLKDKFKDCTAPLSHTVQVRKWEKALQQIYDETNVDVLVKNAKTGIETYFKKLPKPGEKRQFAEGDSPLDYLQLAAHNYATAIKFKPKDANLHLQLGLILEEHYYSEDIFGLKKEESNALPSFNLEAKESSKEEECAAICKIRGVDASTAPIALQLKAIDEEYHSLLDSGQSVKSDHVMALFVWKSKQASQEGAAAQKATDEESPLGQAYLKFMDALVLDEAKALYNFHVGRLLMVQGNYDDAVKRLEVTLGWNPAHQLARSYLGLALALQKSGPGARSKETIGYLLEAMEILLTELSKSSMSDDDPSAVKPVLYGDDLIRPTNVHLLRGIVQLGWLLVTNSDVKDCMAAKDVFHSSALLASQILPKICKGDTYKQIEWVLLESHSNLLDILSSNQTGNEKIIAQRCERLSALIFHSTIPMNDQLLALQEKTCQKLVQIQPCNSHSLYLLGAAQFSKFENSSPGDAANKLLLDIKSSFKASIELEGKPAAGDLPDIVKEQEWWQKKVKEEEEKKKAEEAKQAATAKTAPAGKGAPATRGGAAVRGGPAARGAPAARGRGAPAKPAPAPAARGGAKGGPAAARGGAATKAPAGKTPAPVAKGANSKHVCEPSPTPATPAKEKEPEKPADTPAPQAAVEKTSTAPINRKTHHPRLGLARAHKAANEIPESQKYYNEVIVMAPEVHDAYIELAEMLAKTDPAGAVDIYSKFPISEPPTFDDAYIIGEIVRLLMKAESYGEPKLEKYMILYGRVLGLPVLEKYVKILEDKFKTDLLKKVYAGVNGKDVEDPDLQAFFKFKCWI